MRGTCNNIVGVAASGASQVAPAQGVWSASLLQAFERHRRPAKQSVSFVQPAERSPVPGCAHRPVSPSRAQVSPDVHYDSFVQTSPTTPLPAGSHLPDWTSCAQYSPGMHSAERTQGAS